MCNVYRYIDMDRHFLSFRLEKLCGNSSSSNKVVSTIDTLPWQLSLDSNKTLPPHFWCHIDLYLPSDKYGLNVYIKVTDFLLLKDIKQVMSIYNIYNILLYLIILYVFNIQALATIETVEREAELRPSIQ